MPDVNLLVNEANQDIADLFQANSQMVQALHDMVDQLTPILNDQNGDWQTAWQNVQSATTTAINAMNNDLQMGCSALEQMVDAQIRADGNASQQF